MAKTLTKADYPKDSLPIDVTVQSDDELNQALREMAFIKAIMQSILAACNAECNKIKEHFSNQMELNISGVDISMVERLTDLQRQIETYSDKHKKELLADEKGKTRKFTHGDLSWRDTELKIDYRSGETAATVCKRVVDKSGLVEKVITFLKGLKFGETKLNQLIELKPALSMTKIKAAYKDKTITADELKAIGMKVVNSKSVLTVKPGDFVVKSEAKAA